MCNKCATKQHCRTTPNNFHRDYLWCMLSQLADEKCWNFLVTSNSRRMSLTLKTVPPPPHKKYGTLRFCQIWTQKQKLENPLRLYGIFAVLDSGTKAGKATPSKLRHFEILSVLDPGTKVGNTLHSKKKLWDLFMPNPRPTPSEPLLLSDLLRRLCCTPVCYCIFRLVPVHSKRGTIDLNESSGCSRSSNSNPDSFSKWEVHFSIFCFGGGVKWSTQYI